ncbi:MAG: RNA polymerase sigma factor [Candidatus Pacebacteria bacterium]|nr:RNA polymerase sigma factor [Candidatus Paceibacterota bacterium]
MAKLTPRYFKKIYNLYVEKIYRFVFIKVNSQQIAEDLTSEVFLRFWKTLKKDNSQKIENPKAFLYKTARNLIIDHYRSYSVKKEISIEEVKETQELVQNAKKKDLLLLEIEEIQRALSKLKEEYQDVILWYYLDNLSVEEIAKILGKSENAVRVMIHRAINSLKNHLKV